MDRTTPQPSQRFAVLESPLGPLTVLLDDMRVIGLAYREGLAPGPRIPPAREVSPRTDALAAEVADQLGEYFAGRRRTFELAIRPRGTPFRRRVWEVLQHVPYGTRRTYGQIAALLGTPEAAQAVGQAVGANPISIIIPCHRIVGADGNLTGYRGGLERKRFLLALEEPEDLAQGRLF
ncbi:MAG: methylated-DNA--[protein]-cysteine S-methyltransferase [Bowdeniella nasicola]|nr:methylated-DNA--[protein]-cysteine S-methyltransferase [Bowdeniella nasicola]